MASSSGTSNSKPPAARAAVDNAHNYSLAISFIVKSLIKAYDTGSTLNLSKLKGDAAKKYKLQGIPRLSDILSSIPISHRQQLLPFLKSKPVRTASGVAVVAVMSKPHRCPHINYTNGHVCVYCPGGPDSDFEYSTQVSFEFAMAYIILRGYVTPSRGVAITSIKGLYWL